MPGATEVIDVEPVAPMFANEPMMPQTVPNSPMNGVAAAVVARNGTNRLSRAVSIRAARTSERSTLSSDRIVCVPEACAICASISAYPARNRPTSAEWARGPSANCTSTRRFAFRNTATNRREAVCERSKRRHTMIIAAHDMMEKRRRIARTAFPTTPVCPNAVQSCTSRKVTNARRPRHVITRSRSECGTAGPEMCAARKLRHRPVRRGCSSPDRSGCPRPSTRRESDHLRVRSRSEIRFHRRGS